MSGSKNIKIKIGLLILTCLMIAVFSLSGCSEIKGLNKSMKDFRTKHDKGDSTAVIDIRLMVFHGYLPGPKPGCQTTRITDEKFDAVTMRKIANVTVTAPIDKRTGGFQDKSAQSLSLSFNLQACEIGADGYLNVEISEHKISGIAWAYDKNMKW
ncbi:hypothetical protein KKI24_23790 [bacterium]|nr:hypothetical protein [bacterium]